MELSLEQTTAYNKYVLNQNIFITGPGGTGKTLLIRKIYQDACKRGRKIQVCALTGCAAVLLECKAKTIHSWSGVGVGNGTIEQIVNRVIKNKPTKLKWIEIDVLVVDEVSMMSQKLFETLDIIAKKIRKNLKPFGGIQVIFSGDFYQLPPVGNKDEIETTKFCFESDIWFDLFNIQNHIQLRTIFRQTDSVYQKILNQIREGRLKKSSNEILLKHVDRNYDTTNQIIPTKLFPRRDDAEYINKREMSLIETPEVEYKIKYHTNITITNENEKLNRLNYSNEQIKFELTSLQNNIRSAETIKLKVGAQVMCIVNIPLHNGDILCNGAQGKIVGISSDGFPIVNYKNGHKMTMAPHTWKSETIPGVAVSQIPLILAWALTIHKSQGSTLDIAEIDAGSGIFECGQTYVALSRVKSLEGLYLSSFDASRIKINIKVREFYSMLEREINITTPDNSQKSYVINSNQETIQNMEKETTNTN